MDRIRWINHAGFELQSGDTRIVCDPWLTGLVFNQSWALSAETVYRPEDFEGVDYIWFSHEHPDHFSPQDLRGIPQGIRSRITILFQRTKDGRVANFCRKLGFKEVQEIANWTPIDLKGGSQFSLKAMEDDIDSLCCIKTHDATYLNINDCIARDARSFHTSVAKQVGTIDVLFTQFSYANWVGNPGDAEGMRTHARNKIEEIKEQIAIYRPKIVVPFASFIWFCRPDNFHLNEGANRIEDVVKAISDQSDVVVLYPGDIYDVGTEHDSSEAIRRYALDKQRRDNPLEITDEAYPVEQLKALADEHISKLKSRNMLALFAPLGWLGRLRPVTIFLSDIGQAVRYSMLGGLETIAQPREKTDIEFASGALARMLKYGSGYDTLYISGRFIERRPNARHDLSRHFMVARRNESGMYFPSTLFDPGFLKKQAAIFFSRPR